jgi:hypothetical protein
MILRSLVALDLVAKVKGASEEMHVEMEEKERTGRQRRLKETLPR